MAADGREAVLDPTVRPPVTPPFMPPPRPKRVQLIASALAVAFVLLIDAAVPAGASDAGSVASPCGLGGITPPATYSHVVVIFEENATYAKVIGSSNAPFFNQLALQCGLATHYHEVAGVSQPNYMAATGGQASGVGVHSSGPSIFGQVSSWMELEESMSRNCGGKSTFYKRGHDPAFWYTQISVQCTLYDVAAAASDTGLAQLPDPLPAYTLITPNLCHIDHWKTGCPQANTSAANLKTMDIWLSGTVAKIAATGDYQAGKTLILVVFDESSDSTTTIPMVAVAGGITPIQDATFYDHYALLRVSEEALGIGTFLGNAATANDMRARCTSEPRTDPFILGNPPRSGGRWPEGTS
jgi:phosphatidylinositol-3-phosphatase